MLKNEISILIEDFDWNKPLIKQEKAVQKLVDIDNSLLDMLVQPGDKKLWENAAKVIKAIGYPRIKIILNKLMEWLQDMNWPGVQIILESFDAINKTDIMPFIEEAILKADKTEDYMWLGSIKRLIIRKNINLIDFSNKELYKLLEKADW